MGFLTGKPSKQESSNKSYDFLQGALGGTVGQVGDSMSAIKALLGGDTSGFDQFKKATGFDWGAEQGSRGVTGNAAARGLLRSGSTGKSLVEYGNNYQNQYANNYIQQLLGLGGMGQQSANTIANAGQVQKSTGGTNGLLGPLLSMAASASDERLKENIEYLEDTSEGLGWYEFNYLNDPDTRYRGVMAQEVAERFPEALGPEVEGHMTVYYSKLSRGMEIVD